MSETAAAQLFLDARITPIYEGTNGIQAIDLVGRKLQGDSGAAMRALIAEIREGAAEISRINDPDFLYLGKMLGEAVDALEGATAYMLAEMSASQETALAGASAYLRLAGDVAGGHFLVQSAMAGREEADGAESLQLAAYFAADTLSRAQGAARAVSEGARFVHAAGPDFWDN